MSFKTCEAPQDRGRRVVHWGLHVARVELELTEIDVREVLDIMKIS